MRPSKPKFGSLLLVEEKLLESEHFLRRLSRTRFQGYGYELNAYLSAARSVTFLIQKEMSRVIGFTEWWDFQRSEMRNDPAMKFFLELRNYSQKAGRVSLNGYGSGLRTWSYWFQSAQVEVPKELLITEVSDACRLHLAKLAQLTLRCAKAFPFNTCPHQALTAEGIIALSIDLDDLDEALGYPRGMTKLDGFVEADRLKFMRRHFDGVNFVEIQRLARLRSRFIQPPSVDPMLQAVLKARYQNPAEPNS